MELVDVDTISPGPSEVRLDVAACGICGTDRAFVHDGFPDITWPLTPGHEIAGTIAEVGADVDDFVVGDRVAVGWFGGNCGHCIPCRKGIFIHCENLKVPSWQYPGGYAESVTVPASALARIPPELSFAEAARWAAPELPPTTRCATQRRWRVTGSPFSASAVWDTSGCSSAGRWASRRSRSPAAPAKLTTRAGSVPTTTSTPRKTMWPRHCGPSAV
ncbi:alcohol dehydrogenase GroES-like domain protein [Mycobacterium xenopi 3993]|nr:alcohol dehydrogenase GroES-like domain protein [Mycobacterium xenopi 3993]